MELNSLTFIVLKEHIEKYEIDKNIYRYFPNAYIEIIPEILQGAVLTCMAGIKKIPDGEPIMFNDCDHLFICNEFYDFCKTGRFCDCSGALLTFHSNDDKFSYVAYGSDGSVIRTVEKEVISNDAICGAYYFKDKHIFEESAEEYLAKCVYQEFFVSGVYNIMAEHGKRVLSMHTDEHVSFGTPDEYEKAKSNVSYRRLL